MLVTEFFAHTLGKKCEGPHECKWCGAPCTNRMGPWLWQPSVTREAMKRPSNSYICVGCYFYRRSRVTLNFLDKTYQDRQDPRNHSWMITNEGLTAIRPIDPDMKDILLKPPLTFSLSLIDQVPNQIQLAVLNMHPEIKGSTPLVFTFNGAVLTYTVYELHEALEKREDQGKEPGVRVLLNLIGGLEKRVGKKERGRPPIVNKISRTVTTE